MEFLGDNMADHLTCCKLTNLDDNIPWDHFLLKPSPRDPTLGVFVSTSYELKFNISQICSWMLCFFVINHEHVLIFCVFFSIFVGGLPCVSSPENCGVSPATPDACLPVLLSPHPRITVNNMLRHFANMVGHAH